MQPHVIRESTAPYSSHTDRIKRTPNDMNFLPLFLKQLRNSRTSTLLNLFGLTIALSSFIILIAQVRYELTYDTHFRDADRIFRIERDVPTELGVYSPLLCRPLGERMLASSPDIEAGRRHGYPGNAFPFTISPKERKTEQDLPYTEYPAPCSTSSERKLLRATSTGSTTREERSFCLKAPPARFSARPIPSGNP